MIANLWFDKLSAAVYDTNAALGTAAALDLAAILKSTVARENKAAIILATGNSQLTFLAALALALQIKFRDARYSRRVPKIFDSNRQKARGPLALRPLF